MGKITMNHRWKYVLYELPECQRCGMRTAYYNIQDKRTRRKCNPRNIEMFKEFRNKRIKTKLNIKNLKNKIKKIQSEILKLEHSEYLKPMKKCTHYNF